MNTYEETIEILKIGYGDSFGGKFSESEIFRKAFYKK